MPLIKIFLQIAAFIYLFPMTECWTDPSSLQTLCPYTQFCSRDSPSLFNGTQSCCLPCSCSDTCVQLGNCCPDKQGGVSVPPIYPCKFQSDLYAEAMGINYGYISNDFNVKFRVINACPIDSYYSSSIDVQLSVQNCHKPMRLKNLPFVSDSYDETIYFNKHCAKCNGVENVNEWHLLLECPMIFEKRFSSFKEWENFAYNNCSFLSKPPENVGFLSSICLSDTIDACNHTGLWDYMDQTLERDCRLYNFPYKDEKITYLIYSNVFCYLCNVPKGTPVHKECSEIDIVVTKSIQYPLTILLKLNDDGDTALPTETKRPLSRCAPNEMLDPVMFQCKELICPIGYITVGNSCHKIFNNIDGFCIENNFDIVLTEDQMYMIKQDENQLPNAIIKSMETTLKANHAFSCRFYGYTLFQTSPNRISAMVLVHSTEKCDYISLLKGLADFNKETTIDAVLEGQVVSLPIYMGHNEAITDILWYNQMQRYECVETLTITNETIVCPSVEINPQKLYNASINDGLIYKILDKSFQVSEETYIICVDTYEDLLAQKSTAPEMYSKLFSFLLLAYVISLYIAI